MQQLLILITPGTFARILCMVGPFKVATIDSNLAFGRSAKSVKSFKKSLPRDDVAAALRNCFLCPISFKWRVGYALWRLYFCIIYWRI